MTKDGKLYRGGGIYALEEELGRSRLDVRMIGDNNEVIIMHQLHAKNITYSIKERECSRTKGENKPNNMFAILSKSTFARKTGMNLDVWQYVDPSTNNKIEITLKHGTDEVVHFASGISADGSAPTFEMAILSWDYPEDWVWYTPKICTHMTGTPVGDQTATVYFANSNWNCLDVGCSTRVPAGTAQPNYGCAEFVARSLVYGSWIPNIGTYDPQGSYYGYSYNGNSYDLCLTTGLSSCVGALGWTSLPATASSVDQATPTFGDGGDGSWSHAVIGVNPTMVDAHNNARLNISVSDDLYIAIDAVWGPPGSPPPATTGGGSSTSYSSIGSTTYTSSGALEMGQDGTTVDFVIYDVNNGGKKMFGAGENDMKVIEMNSKSKF